MTGSTMTNAGVPPAAARMYQRVLAAWAMDVLDLRRSGLDVPGHRAGRGIFRGPAPKPAEAGMTMAAGVSWAVGLGVGLRSGD